MKHWIIGGAAAIVGTVLIFRSSTAPRQTLPPPTTGTPTTRGVAWPPTSRVTRDVPSPATTRGVAWSPGMRGTTRPAEAAP